MVESNNNLVGYKDRHKHYELFMKEGFILPKGGVKAGLKGQLVILNRKNLNTANDDDEIEEQNDDHENVNEEKNESNEEVTENGQEVTEANDDDDDDDEYEYY